MPTPTYFRSDGWVKTAQGPAIAGAQIYVCTQPANIASPPTPLALIYADPNGLVPIVQPVITDGLGHYDFYVLPGVYTLIVSYNGVVQEYYPDQAIGLGSGGGTSIALEIDGTPNVDQFLLNLIGTGSTTVTDNGIGGAVINTSGGPTPPAFNTPGQNYFFGAGLETLYGGATGSSAITDTAQRVYVYGFNLDVEWVLSTASFISENSGGSLYYGFGIYNAAGTALVRTSFLSSTIVGVVGTNTFAPVTLPAGYYYFAQASDSAGLVGPTINIPGNGGAFSQTAFYTFLNANGQFVAGFAANPMGTDNGVMPATLGAITGLTTQTQQMAALKWTP
jgi:hypothetical protein